MTYTKSQTLNAIRPVIEDEIEMLYKHDYVNRRGKTTDSKEYYTEVIAKEIVANFERFAGIQPVKRNASYCIESHKYIEYNFGTSNRYEDIFAKRICGLFFNSLGEVIDYQIPLKDSLEDSGVGKIDILAVKDRCLKLVELKYIGNNETLLRAILECYTYYKTVTHDKLLKEYSIFRKKALKIIEPCVLIVSSAGNTCNPYTELMDIGNRPELTILMKLMGIKIYSCQLDCIISENNTY